MPARSKIDQLPPEIREAFQQEMLARNFSDYEGIAAWLNEKLAALGLELRISSSGAHRYGQAFEKSTARMRAATDMAVAFTDQIGDDAGKINDAVIRMYQEKLFHCLLEMNDLVPEEMDFAKLGKVIADITRSSVSQKKWLVEMREKTKQTADDVVKSVKKEGLSSEKAEEIRKKILGIV